MRRKLISPLLLIAIPVNFASAAGYAVREQSADAMASAYAGSAATNTDASYLAFNPAAAATDGGDVSVNLTAIQPESSATYTTALTAAGTPVPGNKAASGFISNAIIPNISIRQRLTDQWSTGFSVSAPWGLSTNYPANFAGRYYGLETKLQTVNFSPVVAYDVTEALTIAGGFQAQYAKGRLTSAVDDGTLGVLSSIPGSSPGAMDGSAMVNAHSWAYGFVLGARAALGDGWNIGLSYRSAVHHKLKGPWTFTPDTAGVGTAINHATGLFADTGATAKLTTPDVAEFGAHKQITENWTGLLEVDWTGWSKFNQLDIAAANPVQTNDLTNAQWHDSWMAAIGVEYNPGNDWNFRGGLAYDQSPVPNATLETRIPDGDRYWISGGVTYHASQMTDLKLSYSHLFVEDRDIAQTAGMSGNALRGSLVGKSDSSVDVVGLEMDLRWEALPF